MNKFNFLVVSLMSLVVLSILAGCNQQEAESEQRPRVLLVMLVGDADGVNTGYHAVIQIGDRVELATAQEWSRFKNQMAEAIQHLAGKVRINRILLTSPPEMSRPQVLLMREYLSYWRTPITHEIRTVYSEKEFEELLTLR